MIGEAATLKVAGWVLMVLAAGLICLLASWLLLRLWRRHDQRHRSPPSAPKQTVLPDAWQASADRLGGSPDPDKDQETD